MVHARFSVLIIAITAAGVLSGCATVSNGTVQTISVQTPNADGAGCSLENRQGDRWDIKSTPGSVSVRKSSGPLTLTCRRDGFFPSTVLVEERLDDKSFGNAYLGGLGLLVDAASGAVVRYPSTIVVTMRAKS